MNENIFRKNEALNLCLACKFFNHTSRFLLFLDTGYTISPEERFKGATLAFIGKAGKREEVSYLCDDQIFEVLKSYKGSPNKKSVRVRTRTCNQKEVYADDLIDYDIEENGVYLVYAKKYDKNIYYFIDHRRLIIFTFGEIEYLDRTPRIGRILDFLKIRNGLHKTYYDNGELMAEINYKYGQRQGIAKWYYEDGNILFEAEYVDGKPEGAIKSYNRDGRLAFDGKYIDGIRGFFKEYDAKGDLSAERYYEKGYNE